MCLAKSHGMGQQQQQRAMLTGVVYANAAAQLMKMIYVSSAHQANNTADIDSASSLYHDYVSLHFYQRRSICQDFKNDLASLWFPPIPKECQLTVIWGYWSLRRSSVQRIFTQGYADLGSVGIICIWGVGWGGRGGKNKGPWLPTISCPATRLSDKSLLQRK